MNLLGFKMKHGLDIQMATFKDELQDIVSFFKESQDEAFDFLNKTKT